MKKENDWGKEINVSHEDIEKGEPSTPGSCPIALSIKRTLNVRCLVSLHTVYILDDMGVTETTLKLPFEATLFVDAFDEGEQVEPFSFQMKKLYPKDHADEDQ